MSTSLHASASPSQVVETATRQGAKFLLHELQVHQIELKMQNTALREAQAALEESRDRYADLYEFAPVGYLSLNSHGLIEDINLTGTKLLNRERGSLLKTPFAQYMVPADRSGWQRFFRQAMQNGANLSAEVELKCKGDERLVVALKCVAVMADGMVTGLRITLTNITPLNQALTDLKIREDRLQLAKAASDLGLFDDDLVSGKHIFDQRLREIWGFSLSEPVSLEQIMAGVHADDRKAAQACLDQAMNPRGNGNYVAQFRVIHQLDGSVRHVAANGQVFFKEGRAIRFIGTVKDISERVRLEAELQERRNAMELLVHQQIATQTAAAIAHDINQPLVAISAYSEAALQMLRCGVAQQPKLTRALEGAAKLATNSITISLQQMTDPPMAQVSVHDSGPGFTPDSARQALAPFYTTKNHGIGLGLAISQALIEANGGQLWVDRPSGAGATLHFSLPFAS